MVSVAAGLGLGGAQKAFQASEQLRSREGTEENKIKEQRRKSALETVQAGFSVVEASSNRNLTSSPTSPRQPFGFAPSPEGR